MDVETSLGFKWEGGISRQHETLLPYPVRTLEIELCKLKKQFVDVEAKELRSSIAFQQHCEGLFYHLGPSLWPDPEVDRSAWLVDSRFDNRQGLYPVNLYFSDYSQRDV